MWCAAIALSRRQTSAFVAVTLTAALCTGATWFFSVSESVLAISLTVLVAVLLWKPRAWHRRDVALAVAAATILVATYESALASGIVLALWASWRAATSSSRCDRYGGVAVAALSAISVLVAISGTQRGAGPTSARSLLYFVVSLDPWQFYVALAGAFGVILAVVLPGVRRLRWALITATSATSALALYHLPASSVSAFQARGGAAGAGLGLVLFLWWLWARESRAPRARAAVTDARDGGGDRWISIVPLVVIGAMTFGSLPALGPWCRSLDAFRAEVDRAQGIVRVDQALPQDRRQVVWSWTSTSLSLIVRRDARSGILVDPRPGYVPFPPEAAREQLPDDFAWR